MTTRPRPSEGALGSPGAGFVRTATRTAILSDIHGEPARLEVALDDARARGCGRVVCLGDMVANRVGDVAVARTLLERGAAAVLGNHDEGAQLTDQPAQAWLESLPKQVVEADVVYTHISPRATPTKILQPDDAWRVFKEVSHRLIFVGHAHKAYLFGERAESYGRVTSYEVDYGRPLQLDPTDRYVIGVGPITEPRDGVKAVRYGIYDPEQNTLEFRALPEP